MSRRNRLAGYNRSITPPAPTLIDQEILKCQIQSAFIICYNAFIFVLFMPDRASAAAGAKEKGLVYG
jgi:hypothetical protein